VRGQAAESLRGWRDDTFQGVANKEATVEEASDEKTFLAPQFAVQGHGDELTITSDGELAIKVTFNFDVLFEAVRKFMLRELYESTLERRDDAQHSNLKDFAEAELGDLARQDASRAAKLSNCLNNPKWVAWFDVLVADATMKLCKSLPKTIADSCPKQIWIEAVSAINGTFLTADQSRVRHRLMAELIGQFDRQQTSKQLSVKPGPAPGKKEYLAAIKDAVRELDAEYKWSVRNKKPSRNKVLDHLSIDKSNARRRERRYGITNWEELLRLIDYSGGTNN
jgi:hypothetical protein